MRQQDKNVSELKNLLIEIKQQQEQNQRQNQEQELKNQQEISRQVQQEIKKIVPPKPDKSSDDAVREQEKNVSELKNLLIEIKQQQEQNQRQQNQNRQEISRQVQQEIKKVPPSYSTNRSSSGSQYCVCEGSSECDCPAIIEETISRKIVNRYATTEEYSPAHEHLQTLDSDCVSED